MQFIDFRPPEDSIEHKCQATRQGDWIVFQCHECPSYERRLNWRTKEMRVRGDRPEVHHSGFYIPTEYPEYIGPKGWHNLN
jgi:hypothetical protein